MTKRSGFKFAVLGFVLLALTLASPATADDKKFSIGLGLGNASDDLLDESDSGWKVDFGYHFGEHWGVEVGHVDLGSYIFGILSQDVTALSVVGTLPVGESGFGFLGKVGYAAWSVSVPGFADATGNDPLWGVGAYYNLNTVGFRVEYETFLDIDGGDVDFTSASVSIRF